MDREQTDININLGPWYDAPDLVKHLKTLLDGYETGKISEDDYQLHMKYFMFDDLYGARWTFDLRQGWVSYDGKEWIRNTPIGPLASIFTNEEFLKKLIPADEQPVYKSTNICKSCSTELPENAKFCSNCAAPVLPPEPLVKICPDCGITAENENAKFCIECGSSYEQPVIETPAVRDTVESQPQGKMCPHCKSMNMGNVSTCIICKKPLDEMHEATPSPPVQATVSAPVKPVVTRTPEPSPKNVNSKKSGCGPGTFSVMLIILILVAAGTFILPKLLSNFNSKTDVNAENLFNQAKDLWEGDFVDGDVNQMEKLLLDSAGKGYGEAMFRLGILYMDGLEDIEADPPEARNWFEKAIDADFDQAYNLLAQMYASGEGGRKDQKKAVELWEKSAKTGDVSAMYTLGMYFLYEMPDSDEYFDEGLFWLQEAADKGSSDAQDELNYLDENW